METKERNQIEEKYKWDLRSLYESDEEWQKDLDSLEALVAPCVAYEGKLKDAEALKGFLDAQMTLMIKMENLYTYASLRHEEDTRAADAQRMIGRVGALFAQIMAATSFAQPEMLELQQEELEKIVADERVADYKIMLEDVLRQKEHMLSKGEEKLLSTFSEVLSASGRTAGVLMNADMTFADAKDAKGNSHQVTNSSFVSLESSRDRVLRQNAFKSLYDGYKAHANTLASTLSNEVTLHVLEAQLRGYSSSRAMALSDANIPEAVYDQLINVVHERIDLMHRYASLRKKMLKLDELHYYDVYTPLSEGEKREYSYEEACDLVLKAVAPLGEEYVETVKSAFTDRWVDVYPNTGKRSGAFSSGTYTSMPYILTNFTGSLEDVSTIAHEMGHSMHSYLTHKHQPYQYSGYKMFVAEVASTVNENLLIETLLEEEKDPQKRLPLLNQYLEGFKGTLYRQTMLAEFEMLVHRMVENHEPMDALSLNELYGKLIRDYFGEDMVVDDEACYEWARIPHYYMNFYVYVYATGYSAAVTLSEKILHEGQKAVDNYLKFLSMGSSAYPIEELKVAGVDMTGKEPIEKALDKFERVLKEAEEIADLLAKQH